MVGGQPPWQSTAWVGVDVDISLRLAVTGSSAKTRRTASAPFPAQGCCFRSTHCTNEYSLLVVITALWYSHPRNLRNPKICCIPKKASHAAVLRSKKWSFRVLELSGNWHGIFLLKIALTTSQRCRPYNEVVSLGTIIRFDHYDYHEHKHRGIPLYNCQTVQKQNCV